MAAAATTVKLVEIGLVGQRVPLADLGAPDGPAISYAVAEDMPPLQLQAPVFLNRPDFASVYPAGSVTRHATVACSVRNCFMFGPFGFVVLPDGSAVRQSVLQYDAMSMTFAFDQFKGQFPGRHIMWSTADETVLSFNGYSTNNYFHFLIDALAQLHWRQRLPSVRNARMIISGYTPEATSVLPFVEQALERAGVTEPVLYPFDGTMMFCRHVVFPARDTGATADKVKELRQMMGVAGRPRGCARLYITRPGATRRKVINESAVAAVLERHGFKAVDPGALTFDQQVELFADAEIIVGPHGAGLTNAVFMAPGGAVVELTHTGRVVWTFHEIACASGLAYACIVGDKAGAADNNLFADFSVDVDAVDAAVTAALRAVAS